MNIALLWIQTITLIAIVLTLIVYYLQLKTMQHGSKCQNFLTLVEFLQAEEIRLAREHVITKLAIKDYKQWTTSDCALASTVCASYGNAGVFVKYRLIHLDMLNSWGPSIKRCFIICQPLIEDRRKDTGSEYWIDFDKLHDYISL